MNMRVGNYSIFIICIFALSYLYCANTGHSSHIYGSVASGDYLTGTYDSSRHELFVSLSEYGIPTNKPQHYLRQEAAQALKEMYTAFHREHPNTPFWVQSSTRNFSDQKLIWEGKWSGRITVMEKRLDTAIPDPMARAVEILKFSSMPGASRHHWGTDFDLNVLSNSYYDRGEGRLLFLWLEKNASRYGFCRPYAGPGKGHSEERWHWSYYPLAKIFLEHWNALYKSDPEAFSRKELFHGSAIAGSLAPQYMNTINVKCE